MNDRKIKMIFIITAITTLLLGLIGVTFAYFSSESQIANEFNAGKYKTTATESFVSPTNWKPGDTTPKTLTVKNEGDIDMYVRVSYTESWKNKDGEDLPLEQDGDRVALISFLADNGWTLEDDDYFYYEDVLHPNDVTTSLLESVTFNQNVVGDYECIKEGDKTTCSSTGNSYEGGTYTLTFNIETIQSDARNILWIGEYALNEIPITIGQQVPSGVNLYSGPQLAMHGDDYSFYIKYDIQNGIVNDATLNIILDDYLINDYPDLIPGTYSFKASNSYSDNVAIAESTGFTLNNGIIEIGPISIHILEDQIYVSKGGLVCEIRSSSVCRCYLEEPG